MAAADITVGGLPARIESDTTGAVITVKSLTDGRRGKFLSGVLYNIGPADVHALVGETDTAAALASVVADNGQDAAQNTIPAGGWMRVRNTFTSIAHKTAAGTATLLWQPD